METTAELELKEAKLEIARHHKDFEKISELCEAGLKNVFNKGLPTPVDALKEIRNVVG